MREILDLAFFFTDAYPDCILKSAGYNCRLPGYMVRVLLVGGVEKEENDKLNKLSSPS
jgi:hypothetical protein